MWWRCERATTATRRPAAVTGARVRPPSLAHLFVACHPRSPLPCNAPPRPSIPAAPTRYVAPAARARSTDALTRARLPSKSIAHWSRLQAASVATRRPGGGRRRCGGSALMLMCGMRERSAGDSD